MLIRTGKGNIISIGLILWVYLVEAILSFWPDPFLPFLFYSGNSDWLWNGAWIIIWFTRLVSSVSDVGTDLSSPIVRNINHKQWNQSGTPGHYQAAFGVALVTTALYPGVCWSCPSLGKERRKRKRKRKQMRRNVIHWFILELLEFSLLGTSQHSHTVDL